jgi:hypothetical protein
VNGEVGGGDERPVAGDERPLDGVLQFANVSRPGVPPQQLASVPTQRHITLAHPGSEAADGGVGEEEDVVAAFPQGRQVHIEDAQPVEEVAAEPTGGHLSRQIAVRCGDQADIGLERRSPTQPLEFALLQHTEELDLHRGGELGDLVEKERSAGRQLEAPGLPPVRSREGAALVTEELGLEERVGARHAVDRHKGAVGPGARVMNRACHELLPGPLSPVIRAVVSVRATWAARVSVSRRIGERPMICSKP